MSRLNESGPRRNREHGSIGQRQVVRTLRVLFREVGGRRGHRERVLQRCRGEEAAMRIDRIVASIPEECRRDAGDLDVRNGAIDAGNQRLRRLATEIVLVAGSLDAFADAIFVAHRPSRL